MKKILLSFIIFMLSILSIFSLSGCGLLPYYQNPKSIVIDNEEYISGFYNNLYITGIEYKDFSTSLFTEGNHHWWHLDDSTFDMYYNRHKDSLFWNPTLYCRKDQHNEIKNYYHNVDNFDYYLGIYLENESETKLTENIDRNILERAIALAVDIENSSTKKYKKTNLQLDGKNYIRPTIYRRSKDGLFTTTQREWIYYEENLYMLNYSDGSNGTYSLFLLDDDVNIYIISLLKEYGLID